ncbi:hypothetical protein GGR52DRAFT_135321 [Hypoxylon sp. FL1284]|nr:hypothetical protein GGR52DRAFT_135321 [Hypoxylon sp. FL1284]
MDHPAMDFVMHQPDQGSNASTQTADSRPNRSRCPAFPVGDTHQPPMPSFRSTYQSDTVYNPQNAWPTLPPPQYRWMPEPAFQAAPLAMGQPPYLPPAGPSTYPTPPQYDYRAPMMSLQRIGGTAPIQHSHGNISGLNSGQGGQGSQGIPAQPQVAGQGSGAAGFRSNGTLPPLNPMASSASQSRAPSFNQTPRPVQQTGRNSPPQFARRISISSNLPVLPVPDVPGSSRTESPLSDSPSPPRPAARDTGSEEATTETYRANTSRNQRELPRLAPSDSGWSSEDDSDRDAVAMSLLEAAVSAAPGSEDRVRAHQIMRGAVSSKRVASKKALTSLEKVTISSLPESERSCVICYNNYGVETPEGFSEAPLRLPKCKHVFGDHCIRKWFEESDSCPYCRDKVHSEPQYLQAISATRMYHFMRHHQTQHGVDRERGQQDAPGAEGYGFYGSSPFADFELGASIYRRGDASSGYGTRNAAWHGNPTERRSPVGLGGDNGDIRRRARPHRGSLRYPPRPQYLPQFSPPSTAPTAGNVSQSRQYHWVNANPSQNHSHGHRHSSSLSNTNVRAVPEPPNNSNLQFQTQLGPPETFLNPLTMANVSGGAEEYHNTISQLRLQHISQMSPTYPGPEVYMSNAEDGTFGTGNHSSM